MKKALLFDIDGTLLRVEGLGTQAFQAAFRDILHQDIEMGGINWMGAMDSEVVPQLLKDEEYSDELIHKLIPLLFKTYTRHFDFIVRENPQRIQALPQVHNLLDAVSGYPLGLLTGNIQATAYIKLKGAGLDRYFPQGIGAFASDSDRREDLVPLALQRMRDYYGQDLKECVMIGDSHRDIEVAHAHGLPIIAVATGRMSREELQACAPDYLFNDFSEWEQMLPLLI